MSAEPPLRVSLIEVDRLFDLFDHRVELNLEHRITILHGPNGVGKTMLLRMVNDLLLGRYGLFRQVPFQRFVIGFSNGQRLELIKEREQASGKRKSSAKLKLSLVENNGRQRTHEVSPREDLQNIADTLSRRMPWIRQVGIDDWSDDREGIILTSEELVRLYSTSVLKTDQAPIKSPATVPEWLSELRASTTAHLIEAQRLLRLGMEAEARYRPRTKTIYRVLDCATDLLTTMRGEMARYGQKSQQLDQTFPQRLLSSSAQQLESRDLKIQLDALDAKRAEFKHIELLEEFPGHPFDQSALDTLDSAQQGVMTLYVNDTAEKLAVLDDLAGRVRLLLDNVNRKLLGKRIRIDRKEGLIAERDDGVRLMLDTLSSGEQHELVLHYDLLFRVQPNTLVLIDEPELSLHVAWQKRFLPDLLEIVKVTKFDVILATHSPYIVGDRSDLMIGLGPDAT